MIKWKRSYHENTGLLQIERNFLVELVVRTIFYEEISLRKKLSKKIARFSTQKIDPVTGVRVMPVAGLSFENKNRAIFLESFFRERNFCPEQLSRAKNVARF